MSETIELETDEARELEREVAQALAAIRANVDAFVALEETTPADEVLRRFDGIGAPLNGLGGRVGLYTCVHPDKDVRTRCEAMERDISALMTELGLSRPLYERLAAVRAEDVTTPEAGRLLEHALRDFRRSGVDRDEATRERIRALRAELVEVGQGFDRNIAEDESKFVVDAGHAGLAGCPADFLAAHPEREDGTVELGTGLDVRMPLLSYAERGDVRRAYFQVAMNRAYPQNLPVLERLLALRHELAGLLGHAHWADYATGDKMARDAATVRTFLERVVALVGERARGEAAELLAVLQAREPGATELHEADRQFLTEVVRRERFGFDAQRVRPYFAIERVKAGLFRLIERLYGVRLVRADEPAWHPDVESWDLCQDGATIARFHLDLFPREGKFKHAAMFHLAEGLAGGKGPLPEAALVCNFRPPGAEDPGLMEHDQVTTLFHEFGHLLHHLFASTGSWLAFAGISTEHDFVEVPSQLFEEWAWRPEVLREFALHVETDEPIPADLVASMRAASEYGKAYQVLWQMFFATLSLRLYDRDPAGVDVTEVVRSLKRELLPIPHTEGTHVHASFGHLHGYSAMYYTYMWSLVIAKDLFGAFGADPLDAELAARYRRQVLAPGGARDAAELVREFLGRDYSFDAFEAWLQA